MKRLPLALATPATIFLALTLTACGDDVTKVTETGASVTAVESEANLPDCGSDNNGSFVIAQDKQKVFVCYSEKWFTLNGNDGSTQSSPTDSVVTGQKGADGKNGTNGTNGANGTSCTGVAFESGDSTGFKIVCGKDTLGVILNGKDGIDGKNGRHGMVPGLASKLAKRMKRGVNTDFFDNLSKFTGFNDEGLEDKGYLIRDGLKDVAYPNELKKTHFKTIADAGFDHVRLQVRWDHFTGDSAKCQIDPEYMKQIKWAVDNTIANGMIAVVDEHYLAFRQTEDAWHPSNGYTYAQISPCLKSIYKQITDSMATYSTDSLIIELSNEPNFDNKITATQWTNLADSLIQIIHGIDPARVIIVGSRGYYDRLYLSELNSVIAKNNADGLLMASFHYYDPMSFTGSNDRNPATWEETKANKFAIYDAFSNVASWAKSNNIPVYLGEFGTNNEIPATDAVEKWLTAIISAADYYGFAMAIHDFSGYYFTYNLKDKKWVDYKIRPLFNPKYDMSLNPDDYDLTKLSATPMEDFDGSYPTNTYFGKSWFTYSENVTKLAATTMANCGNDQKCFHGKFTVASPGGNKYPTFTLGIDIPLNMENWSSIKAISFYAKGSGLLKVAIPTNGTLLLKGEYPDKGWIGEFASEVVLTDEWKQYIIWSDGLVPEKYSWLDTLNGKWTDYNTEVSQFCFWRGSNLNPESNTTVEWFIDDIVLYK